MSFKHTLHKVLQNGGFYHFSFFLKENIGNDFDSH